MPLRIVKEALARPHHCVVYPQLGSHHEEGFFDTGNECGGHDPHGYISVAAARTMASELGYVTPDDHSVVVAQRDAAMGRIESLEREVAERQQKLDAIWLIESEGFKAQRKRGPKQRVEA